MYHESLLWDKGVITQVRFITISPLLIYFLFSKHGPGQEAKYKKRDREKNMKTCVLFGKIWKLANFLEKSVIEDFLVYYVNILWPNSKLCLDNPVKIRNL